MLASAHHAAVAADSPASAAPASTASSASTSIAAFALVSFHGKGKCLEVAGGEGQLDNGRIVHASACVSRDNQRWIYVDGEIRGLGGKCLDSLGGENGARVQVYDCWSGPNQRWTFDNGTLRGMNGRCLDVAGGKGERDDGARLQLYDCVGSPNQQWHVQGVSTPHPNNVRYTNPVFAADFADPFVLQDRGTYYGFATNSASANVQVITSKDLTAWLPVADALPQLPSWAQTGHTWAPSVLARPHGSFVLYYTVRPKNLEMQCISRAVATQPAGPYVDDSPKPLVCQQDAGGSIDPSPFVDERGTPYLTWKNDGNCCGMPVSIWSQELTAEGTSLLGAPARLLNHDQSWETPLIEGPSMLARGGKYLLFYSANWWESADYGVGYGVCDTPRGPCRKSQSGPILHKADAVAGPGGQEFFRDPTGGLYVAYHAWTFPHTTYAGGGVRSLRIDRVVFDGVTPVILGPTATPQ